MAKDESGLPLHFLDQIVNVQWEGGAVFIAADDFGSIFYLKGDSEAGWQTVATFIDYDGTGDPFAHAGSAHALVGEDQTSTFVVVSYGGGTTGTGAIFASKGGLEWSKVFSLSKEQPDRNISATIFGVVWDGSNFWAGAHQSLDQTSDDRRMIEIDILLTSQNGFSWSEAGRYEIVRSIVEDPNYITPEYKQGLLAQHCSSRVVDEFGNGAPDGFYGFNPENDILIMPTGMPAMDYFFGGIFYPDASGVTINNPAQPIPSDPGLPTLCVARSGDQWVAAGGLSGHAGAAMAAILVSDSESGFSWKRVDPVGPTAIVTIVGGPPPPPEPG